MRLVTFLAYLAAWVAVGAGALLGTVAGARPKREGEGGGAGLGWGVLLQVAAVLPVTLTLGDGPLRELVDLRQAVDLRPQGDVHGFLLAAADGSSSASVRSSSCNAAGPARSTRARGSDKTWVSGAWYATKS